MDSLKDMNSDQIRTLVAVCALFVSLLSICLTIVALWLQRRHYFKSLTPIANILIGDYEQELSVKIRNTGVGPLIVESLIASVGDHEEDDIISWMPKTPNGIYWSTFIDNIDGWCIPPNQEVVIIRLSGKSTDGKFASFRNDVRHALSRLTLTLKYKDIYDRKMPIKQRDLKWFARHFAPELPQSNEKT